MKLGSLFDGIGGFPLAATMHGIEPVWASEIEPFPIEVTKARFPGMKHLGDITQINGAEIEPVDIITFGSPCQDLSVAGKRDGLEGKRSNLFFEAVRIIREMRGATDGRYPRFAVWENVPGAFSSNGGADFQSVLEEITESKIPMPHTGRWATAGMVRGGKCEVAWRVLDAQYWGVPQRRRRIFLVADFAGQRAGEILFECEGVSRDIAESRKSREEVAAGAGTGAAYTVRMREGCAGGAGNGVTLSGEGTQIVPTVSAKWHKGSGGPAGDECQNLVAFACNQRDEVRDMKDKSGALQAQPGMKQQTFVLQGSMIGRQDHNGPQGDGINKNVSFTLNTTDRHAVAYAVRTANTGANGHGIAEDKAHTLDQAQGQAVAQLYENHGQDSRLNGPLEVAPTVAQKFGTGGNNTPLVEQGYTVRRLTPLECERLQGFPDGWTSIEGASDTGRYKALGNSVAIPCVSWIIGRIKSIFKMQCERWEKEDNDV